MKPLIVLIGNRVHIIYIQIDVYTAMPILTGKPLGHKAYFNIRHLLSSKLGKHDKFVDKGQDFLATQPCGDPKLLVIIQEKLDGSCVSVARIDNDIVPLIKRGHTATSSPYEMHHLFANWVENNKSRFLRFLDPGERLVGEWLAMAHGTKYILKHEPFVPFDIIRDPFELGTNLEMAERFWSQGFAKPFHVWVGQGLTPTVAMMRLGEFGMHGATDPVEGVIYRVEKQGKVLFLAKYVRSDFEPGRYLPEVSGKLPYWHWRPELV